MVIFRILLGLIFIFLFFKKNVFDKELNFYEDKIYWLVIIIMFIIVLIDFKNKLSHKKSPNV
jgi:hypothetical protein